MKLHVTVAVTTSVIASVNVWILVTNVVAIDTPGATGHAGWSMFGEADVVVGVCVIAGSTDVRNVLGNVCIVVSHDTEASIVLAGVCVVVVAGTEVRDVVGCVCVVVAGATEVMDVAESGVNRDVGIAAGACWTKALPAQSVSVRSAPLSHAWVAKSSFGWL